MKLLNLKTMTKEEKKELAKKTAIGAGIFVTGIVIGKKLYKVKADKDLAEMTENINKLELDIEELENHTEWLEETTKKADKAYKHNQLALRKAGIKAMDEVYERDIAIMDLVDGNKNKYRAARQVAWEKPEEHIGKLEFDTERAHKAWVAHEQKKQELF